MRHFAKPTSIDRLSLEARLVYSVFCVFIMIGFASSVWLYADDDLGFRGEGAARYYLGDEREPERGGPTIDLPAAEALRFEKPARQIVETFHFHLFSVPVCLLIVAHLFMMGREPTRMKVLVIGVGSASTLLHLLLPPMIRFASPATAGLMFPSAVVMTIAWLYMTMSPLAQMWMLRSDPA
jgi:hypothetical protein